MSHFSYNRLAQTPTRDFRERKKRNIIKSKGTAKISTLRLSILRRPMLVRLIRANTKLFVITIAKRNIISKIISSPKPTPLQTINNQLKSSLHW